MFNLTVNGETHVVNVEADKPLLWVLREDLKLTGTKFGCGLAQCGACTVHIDGAPMRSCITPISLADGKSVTTIEGIAPTGDAHPVQQAWLDHQVPQCGYCQSGQIMSAVALLESTPNPTDSQIDTAMKGNICRCGMYGRIKSAIKSASGQSVAQPTLFDPATDKVSV